MPAEPAPTVAEGAARSSAAMQAAHQVAVVQPQQRHREGQEERTQTATKTEPITDSRPADPRLTPHSRMTRAVMARRDQRLIPPK